MPINPDGYRAAYWYHACLPPMEKWQRDGFESFGAWRRADQKRRDDAKRDAKRAARAAAAAPSPPPLAVHVVLAKPFAAGTREVNDVYWQTRIHGCCSHHKRVRIADVAFAPVVGPVVMPITPLTLTATDYKMAMTLERPRGEDAPKQLAPLLIKKALSAAAAAADYAGAVGVFEESWANQLEPHMQMPSAALRQTQSSPKAQFRGYQEHIQVTPGGSRVHKIERTTPGGTHLTAEYTSPVGVSAHEAYLIRAGRHMMKPDLALSVRSRSAESRRKFRERLGERLPDM